MRDVNLKDYVDARFTDAYRYIDAELKATATLASVRDEKNSTSVKLAFDGANEATRAALDAAAAVAIYSQVVS